MFREDSCRFERRRLLQTLGVTIAGGAGLTAGTSGAGAQEGAFVTVENQRSEGDSLVIAEVSTPTEGELFVQDQPEEGQNTLFGRESVSPETNGPVTIDLDTSIEDSQMVEVWLIDGDLFEDDWDVLNVTEAFVSVDEDVDPGLFGVNYFEPEDGDGFNYPYFLYTPVPQDGEEKPMTVEPNNTGMQTDDFEKHRDRAERIVGGTAARGVSDALNTPLLVPVFPRPRTDPVDGSHYTHALDDTTLSIEGGPLERIDLQLLRMVDHAREKILASTEHSLTDQIMLNGFSASGNFVDRFAVLHPDRVCSVTAGALNGMAILPLEEADGHTLPYHVGIADVEELTGEPVDLAALDEVDQFLYMGGQDTNDTIPYDDAWTDDELRQTALAVYGDDMITERFPRCQEAYWEVGIEAQFKIYPDEGHSPRVAREDIVEFHRRSVEGGDVSEFGETIAMRMALEVTPTDPSAGESITFDAGGTEGGISGVSTFAWEFGDDTSAVGEEVSHTFETPGTYTVTLTAIGENGQEKTATTEITVGEADTDATEVTPAFRVTPSEPTVGEEVEFDAGESEAGSEIISYSWDFEDGETASAEVTSHTFQQPGEYTVTLTVVTEDGDAEEVAEEITVAEGEATDGADADDDGSGFGLGAAAASLGGVSYLLKRRLTGSDSE